MTSNDVSKIPGALPLSPSDGERDGVRGRSEISNENQSRLDPALCPLCGEPNECQLCTVAAYKGPCWCATVSIPDELLARVPAEQRNRACICKNCVTQFHQHHAKEGGVAGRTIRPGDFYFENGLMVFTAAYLQRRGYCCDNNCRHCPYQPDGRKKAQETQKASSW
jgi:hypothetical protein